MRTTGSLSSVLHASHVAVCRCGGDPCPYHRICCGSSRLTLTLPAFGTAGQAPADVLCRGSGAGETRALLNVVSRSLAVLCAFTSLAGPPREPYEQIREVPRVCQKVRCRVRPRNGGAVLRELREDLPVNPHASCGRRARGANINPGSQQWLATWYDPCSAIRLGPIEWGHTLAGAISARPCSLLSRVDGMRSI